MDVDLAWLWALLETLAPWLGGAVAGILSFLLLNRRITLTYAVNHDRIGITANDNILGNVSVLVGESYNASNLYLSKVYITNRSLKDIEDLPVTAYVNSSICNLLTERASILDSITPIRYSEQFEKEIAVDDQTEQSVKDQRLALWKARREYDLPTLNRGSVLELTYLVDVAHGSNPGTALQGCRNALSVWLGSFSRDQVVHPQTCQQSHSSQCQDRRLREHSYCL